MLPRLAPGGANDTCRSSILRFKGIVLSDSLPSAPCTFGRAGLERPVSCQGGEGVLLSRPPSQRPARREGRPSADSDKLAGAGRCERWPVSEEGALGSGGRPTRRALGAKRPDQKRQEKWSCEINDFSKLVGGGETARAGLPLLFLRRCCCTAPVIQAPRGGRALSVHLSSQP